MLARAARFAHYRPAIMGGRRVVGAAAAAPLLTSMVDYWNLSEASGTRVGSHAGLDLTDNNTVGQSAGGGPDGGDAALLVEANSEYLSRASSAALQTGDIDFTLAVWFYMNSVTGSTQLMGKGGIGFLPEYALWLSGDVPAFTVDGAAHNATVAAIGTGAWRFALAWHDSTAGTVNISIDDGAPGSAVEGTVQAVDTQPFGIGAAGFGADYTDGRMAYAGMWKRLLTPAEKTWLYNAGAGRTYAAVAAYTG